MAVSGAALTGGRCLPCPVLHRREMSSERCPVTRRSDLTRGDLTRGDLTRDDLTSGDLGRLVPAPFCATVWRPGAPDPGECAHPATDPSPATLHDSPDPSSTISSHPSRPPPPTPPYTPAQADPPAGRADPPAGRADPPAGRADPPARTAVADKELREERARRMVEEKLKQDSTNKEQALTAQMQELQERCSRLAQESAANLERVRDAGALCYR